MRYVANRWAVGAQAALVSQIGRFETGTLSYPGRAQRPPTVCSVHSKIDPARVSIRYPVLFDPAKDRSLHLEGKTFDT